ncbi:hypothetical protein HOY82DRAFT_544330 [Tuber indicum]|nr:hypothetical protein HOY82DRAFT_544330 [Tuber indicum]
MTDIDSDSENILQPLSLDQKLEIMQETQTLSPDTIHISDSLPSDSVSYKKFCQPTSSDLESSVSNYSLLNAQLEYLDRLPESFHSQKRKLEDLIQNENTLANFQRELEFEIHLKASGLKLVREECRIVEKEELLVPKDKHRQMEEDQRILLKEILELQERNATLKTRKERLEGNKLSIEKDLGKQREDIEQLVDDMKAKILNY